MMKFDGKIKQTGLTETFFYKGGTEYGRDQSRNRR